jgi:hypothetical protein
MSVSYGIDKDNQTISDITIDITFPFVYFELLVRTAVKMGLSTDELLLLSLDKYFTDNQILAK